ncbi:hypothetical protein CC78DRAFT_577425 [Lojkania enalia]|uniref:Antifreeze protein n=1 Tax=Lojkania enalia TaxID=147567 RepID=A0A9P4KEI7_9PLEO|nr:hypothetical protein CC78DRAFT_577425 [Didymosphaeria enalia]
MRFIYVASLLFATVAVANPLSSLAERSNLVLRQFGCVSFRGVMPYSPLAYFNGRNAMRAAAAGHHAAQTEAANVSAMRMDAIHRLLPAALTVLAKHYA